MSDAGERGRPGEALAAWLLPLLLVSAFALRVWFASGGLDYRRFFDERYSLDNVAALLDGRPEPVWGWYPSLSYLPQTALLFGVERLGDWTGSEKLRVRRGDRFTATGIAICRVLGCLYGTASIWLLYLLGRRLFDPATGLVAAFLLAVVPEHVRLSAYIKPDSLMVLTLLVAFLAALAAYDHPSWRRFLLAGAAIGLVGSAKPYGVAVAAPLAAVAVAHARRLPGAWLRLAAAAAAAAAVFLALNPHLGLLLEFAQRNRAIYAGKGAGLGSIVEATLSAPFTAHGRLVGAVAVAGLAALVGRAAARSRPRRERAQAVLVLVFVASYVGLVWVLFRWAKANLWLPLMPFTALAAALALLAAGRALRRWLPAPAGAVAAVAAVGLVLAAQQARVLRWSYQVRVPTTWQAASDYLAFRLPPPLTGRLIWAETPPGVYLPAVRAWTSGHATPIAVEDLAGVPGRRLDRADAEVFPLVRLGGEGSFHRRRLERFPASRELVVEPRFLARRGEPLQLVLHPWRQRPGGGGVEMRAAPEPSGRFLGELAGEPSPRPNQYVSLVVRTFGGEAAPRAALGRRELPLFFVRDTTDGQLRVSDRVLARPAARALRIDLAAPARERPPEVAAIAWEYRVDRREGS